MLHYISAALPQNDVSVAAPFFFTLRSALLPKVFLWLCRLKGYHPPLRFRRGFMHLSGQHHKSAITVPTILSSPEFWFPSLSF